MIKYNINTCDQIVNEIMVHFTKSCENKCAFCIDSMNIGVKPQKPDIENIFKVIYEKCNDITDVTFSGGEPCLYLEELLKITKLIKSNTKLRVNIISSMPTECWVKKDILFELIELIDNFAFSPQHYDEDIADKIRGVKSKYNHQKLYEMLPHKEKICVNINLIKGILDKKEDVCKCIEHYNKMGFNMIKVAELFNNPDLYVSFEKIFDVKLKSPFSHGCKTKFNIKPWIPNFNGTFILKRTCFMNNPLNHATLSDLFKVCTRNIFSKKYSFGVLYENAELKPYWE